MADGIAAYAIGIDLVSNAAKATGGIDALLKQLERVEDLQGRIQVGWSSMSSGLRDVTGEARALASVMQSVAQYAEAAARASGRINAGGGGGGAGGVAMPMAAPRQRGPSVAMPAAPSAMPPWPDMADPSVPVSRGVPMLAGPPAPAGLLTYDPTRRDYVTPSGVPMYGATGPGVPVGMPYGPGTALVPVGPASGGGGASFANPGGSAGALVPFSGGGGRMVPRTGFIMPPEGASPLPLAPLAPGTAALYSGKLPRLPSLPVMPPGAKMLGAYLGYETLHSAFEHGAEADDIIAKMQAMRVMGADGNPAPAFTAAQIEQTKSSALATMRRVPGMGYAQGLDITLQTAGLLGNSTKAMELSPQLSFNAAVLASYGKGDAIAQIEKAVQAGELTGLTGKDGQVDVGRLTDFVNRITRTTAAMGGQLDIGKYLTGIRQFGLGAEAADLDFTTATLPAYMKIMGEAKAGTALTSLQQVLLAPVPKTRADNYQKEQERIGLRSRTGTRELVNVDGLKSNTQDWFLQTLLPTLAAAGYKAPGEITGEIQRLLPRQTVDRLAGAGLMDRALIEKETQRNLAQQRAGDAPLAALLANAPGAQFKAFSENIKAFEAVTTDAAMGPSVDIIKRITASFQGMTDYVKAHPNDVRLFAQDVDLVIKMMLSIAKTTGAIWGALPGPLKGAVAGAAAGGLAGSVIPGIGTGAGAIAGAGLGFFNGPKSTAPDIQYDYGHWGPSGPTGPRVGADGMPASSLRGLMHNEAYVTGGDAVHMQPIALTISLDGRTLARSVTAHQTRRANSVIDPGTNGFDAISTPRRAGVPVVTA